MPAVAGVHPAPGHTADEVLTLTFRNMEAGVAAEEIEVRGEGPSFETGFNAKYLLDVASQIEAEETRIEFNDAASPARVLDTKDDGAQYVLMPLRV